MSIIADIHHELDLAGIISPIESRPFQACSVDYRTKLKNAITRAFGRDDLDDLAEEIQLQSDNDRLVAELSRAAEELRSVCRELADAHAKIAKLESKKSGKKKEGARA